MKMEMEEERKKSVASVRHQEASAIFVEDHEIPGRIKFTFSHAYSFCLVFKRLDIAFIRVSGKIDMRREKNLSHARAIVHFESI